MNSILCPAIFLDRDGIINKAIVKNGLPYPPGDNDEFEFCNNIEELIIYLKKLGYMIFVVTNQPDVKRGNTSKDLVEEFNNKIKKKFPQISEILVCFHDDSDNCKCRKPLPGMVLELAKKYSINLPKSYFIGDRYKDIECGINSGCKTIFIDMGYLEALTYKPTVIMQSLLEVILYFKKQEGKIL